METEGSLSHLQKPATCPSTRLYEMFRNGVESLRPGVVSILPNLPKLEDHPLLAVRYCLFNIFAATVYIWRPFVHLQLEDSLWCQQHIAGHCP
jgi:hypothetical protein